LPGAKQKIHFDHSAKVFDRNTQIGYARNADDFIFFDLAEAVCGFAINVGDAEFAGD